jgi:hypothetical protein
MRYSRALLGLLVIALASVIGGSLIPGTAKHKAYSEDAQQAKESVSAKRSQRRDHYYLLMFSSQNNSYQARFSHTFASFVKAMGAAPSLAESEIAEVHTISWMPQTQDIVLLRRQPEPGTNLNLQDSIRWAQSVSARISLWGPYEIQKELYDRAVEQEARLKSGAVMYKAIDDEFRPAVASNCIHAVCDIDADNGLFHIGRLWGEPASQLVLGHFKRWILDPDKTHPWLIQRLELKDLQVRNAWTFAPDRPTGF